MIHSSHITKAHKTGFCTLLNSLVLSEHEIAPYPLSYLQHLLTHKEYFVEIYTQVLNEAIANTNKTWDDSFLIDYGAGNGLLGLFAKFCGFRKVVLLDISEEFLHSTSVLSEKLNIKPDGIICGELKTLKIEDTDIPDIVVGTDVIEHIYDLNSFFSTLHKMNSNLVTVFTTASNDKNWLKKRKLMRIQKIDEWRGWKETEQNPGYPSFREIRHKIISETLPSLEARDLEEMITNTRGLNKPDIILACERFTREGVKPVLIKHPTNTCDPMTGSWTERLLTDKEYKLLYKTHGFDLRIKNGYYNQCQSFPKSWPAVILNCFIKTVPVLGKQISPLLLLIGKA